MKRVITIRIAVLLLAFVLPPLCLSLTNIPFWRETALFLTTLVLWISEVLPLSVTALSIPLLVSIYGIMPLQESFAPFGSDVVAMFIGVFLIARAVSNVGLDRRVASAIIGERASNSPFVFVLLVTLASSLLSMWIANVACTALMVSLLLGAIRERSLVSDRTISRALLGITFGATIGGMMTPVGTPTNMIGIAALRLHGFEVGFVDWVVVACPIAILMLCILLIVLCLPILMDPDSHRMSLRLNRQVTKWSKSEFFVCVVLSLVIASWVLPPLLSHFIFTQELARSINSYFSMSSVALSGALILFIGSRINSYLVPDTQHLPLRDGELNSIDWNTILLFAGGMSLGAMLDKSGVARAIGEMLAGMDRSSIVLMVVAAIGSAILLSEFTSNTATASILSPIVLATCQSLSLSAEVTIMVVILTVLATSFGFMLPIATPPNAIVYATGLLPAREMRNTGIFLDLMGFALLSAVVWAYF